MHGSETYRVAGMLFRSDEIATLEEQHRQFLGCLDVVGIDRNEALQQCHRGLLLIRALANVVEHPQCIGHAGGDVQHVEAKRLDVILDGNSIITEFKTG